MDLDFNRIVEFNPQEDYTEEEKAEIVANYINILRQSRINQMEHMITTINMLLTLDDVDAIHTILEKVRSSYIKTIMEDIKDKS